MRKPPADVAPIRAVVLDLGGVVLRSPLTLIADFERQYGIGRGTISQASVYAGISGPWQKLERGEIDAATFGRDFDMVLASFNIPPLGMPLIQAIGRHCTVRPRMLQAIRRLRAARYKVGALTNIWNDEPRLAATLNGLRSEFDGFVESWREGVRKPEPAIYSTVCRILDIAPAETVFIDDIGHNLKPARALGMYTIRFKSVDQALNALRALLNNDSL